MLIYYYVRSTIFDNSILHRDIMNIYNKLNLISKC